MFAIKTQTKERERRNFLMMMGPELLKHKVSISEIHVREKVIERKNWEPDGEKGDIFL
jgi:hypothetical protein